jgi:hypothetical protein
MIFNCAVKFGVSPKLISTRLLSEEDKGDMLAGHLSEEALECHIQVWKVAGMPDIAHGLYERYRPNY